MTLIISDASRHAVAASAPAPRTARRVVRPHCARARCSIRCRRCCSPRHSLTASRSRVFARARSRRVAARRGWRSRSSRRSSCVAAVRAARSRLFRDWDVFVSAGVAVSRSSRRLVAEAIEEDAARRVAGVAGDARRRRACGCSGPRTRATRRARARTRDQRALRVSRALRRRARGRLRSPRHDVPHARRLRARRRRAWLVGRGRAQSARRRAVGHVRGAAERAGARTGSLPSCGRTESRTSRSAGRASPRRQRARGRERDVAPSRRSKRPRPGRSDHARRARSVGSESPGRSSVEERRAFRTFVMGAAGSYCCDTMSFSSFETLNTGTRRRHRHGFTVRGLRARCATCGP